MIHERYAAGLRAHREDLDRALAAFPEVDPLTVPEAYGSVAEPDGWDLLDGAIVGSWLWLIVTATVVAGLAAVLLVLGLRRMTRG